MHSKLMYDQSVFLSMLEQRRLSADDSQEQDALLQQIQRVLSLPDLSCYNCAMYALSHKIDIPQSFTYFVTGNHRLDWSIVKAEEVIDLYKLPSVPLSEVETWDYLQDHDISTKHIDHIPMTSSIKPGIAAFTGDPTQLYVLIDGNHRAARALREKKPFSVYLLNRELSPKALLSKFEVIKMHAKIQQYLYSDRQ